MAATSARAAFGTVLQYGDGETPEAFTSVAQITSITPPEKTRAMEDATHFESPLGYEEFVPTTKNAGEPAVDLDWIPGDTSHDALDVAMDEGAKNWKVAYPDFGRVSQVAVVTPVTNILTDEAHGYYTGQPVRLATSGAFPTSSPQVNASTTYFIGVEDVDTFKLYATNAAAILGTGEIAFSTAGTVDPSILSGTVASFSGALSGLSTPAELKGKLMASVKIKASGPLVFAP